MATLAEVKKLIHTSNPSKVTVNPDGTIVITDPKVSDELKKLPGTDPEEGGGINVGGCDC